MSMRIDDQSFTQPRVGMLELPAIDESALDLLRDPQAQSLHPTKHWLLDYLMYDYRQAYDACEQLVEERNGIAQALNDDAGGDHWLRNDLRNSLIDAQEQYSATLGALMCLQDAVDAIVKLNFEQLEA